MIDVEVIKRTYDRGLLLVVDGVNRLCANVFMTTYCAMYIAELYRGRPYLTLIVQQNWDKVPKPEFRPVF